MTLFTLGTIPGIGAAQLGQSCLDGIVALLAIFIRIPVALEVERLKSREQELSRSVQLLNTLRASLIDNIDKLKDVHRYLASPPFGLPSFPLNLVALDPRSTIAIG